MKIGIIGLGNYSSIGFSLSKRINNEMEYDALMINDRDNPERIAKVETHARHILHDRKTGYATLKEMAKECDITFLCAENTYGASKAEIPQRRNIRQELFDGNIKMVEQIAEKFHRENYTGKLIMVTNPTDLLSYFFAKKAPKTQVLGFNHVDTHRFENEMMFCTSTFEERPIDKVVAEIWGEHGPNSMTIPSQIRVFCGEEKRIIDYPEIVDMLEEKKREMDGLPFHIIKDFTTTTGDTIDALTHMTKCILQGKGRFVASAPYQFGGEEIYLGQPCEVRGDDIKVVEKDVKGLHSRIVITDGNEKSEKDRWFEIVTRNYDTIKKIKMNGMRYVGGEPEPAGWQASRKHLYVSPARKKTGNQWMKYVRIGLLIAAGAMTFGTGFKLMYMYKKSKDLSSESNASYLSRNTNISHRSP